MRAINWLLAVVCCISMGIAGAASITPEEQKLQGEFRKAYNNPDANQRKVALGMLSGTKHSSSWAILNQIASSDPDADVRLEAFTALSKVPARDTSVARMLAGAFASLKPNDIDARKSYSKVMGGSEFKADVSMAIGDFLTRIRYPDIPVYIPGSGPAANSTKNPQAGIDKAKKDRADYEELLNNFNLAANSEIKAPTKETPVALRKWLDANLGKIAQADRELTEKYRKEDMEAAKTKPK